MKQACRNGASRGIGVLGLTMEVEEQEEEQEEEEPVTSALP